MTLAVDLHVVLRLLLLLLSDYLLKVFLLFGTRYFLDNLGSLGDLVLLSALLLVHFIECHEVERLLVL